MDTELGAITIAHRGTQFDFPVSIALITETPRTVNLCIARVYRRVAIKPEANARTSFGTSSGTAAQVAAEINISHRRLRRKRHHQCGNQFCLLSHFIAPLRTVE